MKTFQTEAEYLEARLKSDAHEDAWDKWREENPRQAPKTEVVDSFPYGKEVNNELRSAIEVWEFQRDKPQKYFIYINEERQEATTWTGQRLGAVYMGRVWRDSFGGKRRSIDVVAINGRKYHGTYYCSSGNYARIKQYKNQKPDLSDNGPYATAEDQAISDIDGISIAKLRADRAAQDVL